MRIELFVKMILKGNLDDESDKDQLSHFIRLKEHIEKLEYAFVNEENQQNK